MRTQGTTPLKAAGSARDTPLFATGRGEKLSLVSAGAGAGANGYVTYFVGS